MDATRQTPDGSVTAFKAALERLYDAAGRPTLRELEARVGKSRTTISHALRGEILPSRAVTEALVDGLGGDMGQIIGLWEAAKQQRDFREAPLGVSEVYTSSRERLSETSLKCFWSYAHVDNYGFSEMVDRLRSDLAFFYEAETGRSLDIFVDRQSIGWGEEWKKRIDTGVEQSTFLIPVVTAHYLQSQWCRRELLSFYAQCQQRGVTDLILPVVFAGRRLLTDESPDEVARIIARAQYEDFSEIWQHGAGSPAWVSAVSRLVVKLISAQDRVEAQLTQADIGVAEASQGRARTGSSEVDDLDAPGLADLMQDFVDASTRLGELLEGGGELLVRLGTNATENSEPLTNANDPRAYKTALIRLASSLGPTAIELEEAGRNALEEAMKADGALRSMVDLANESGDKDLKSTLRDQVLSIQSDNDGVLSALQQLNELADQISQLEPLSTAIRKAMRPARIGLRQINDAGQLFLSWANLAPDLE